MFAAATSLDISFIHLLFYSHSNYDKFPKISLIGTFRNARYFTDRLLLLSNQQHRSAIGMASTFWNAVRVCDQEMISRTLLDHNVLHHSGTAKPTLLPGYIECNVMVIEPACSFCTGNVLCSCVRSYWAVEPPCNSQATWTHAAVSLCAC